MHKIKLPHRTNDTALSHSYFHSQVHHCKAQSTHCRSAAQSKSSQVALHLLTNHRKVRRLHLILVDLWRPWRHNVRQGKHVSDQLWHVTEGPSVRRITMLSCMTSSGRTVPPSSRCSHLWAFKHFYDSFVR